MYLIIIYICLRIERKEGDNVPFFITKKMSVELVTSLIEEKLQGSEIFPVDVKITPGKILVAIDKPTGITIEECTEVSRYLYEKLDSSGLLETHELEVGSPGMDQPLKVYKQYLRRIGRQVKVVTKTGSVHQGKLESASESGITVIESETVREGKKKVKKEETVVLAFDDIKETKLELSFNKHIK